MGKKRIRHSTEFKAKVALEALKGLKTVNELAGHYQVRPTRSAHGSARCKGAPKNSLRMVREKATKRPMLCQRNSTKKSDA